MVEPRIIPREEHPISRQNIDPDALKVLYRLRQSNYTAYLVGGSVRDLLIGRRPKDFDIGTSAHPYQVKKLFRNCWIIGRRFRLAHVRFGPKVIEVATFRRQVGPGEEPGQDDREIERAREELQQSDAGNVRTASAETTDYLIHHDNTFGTAEEDAFRRDFTANALFYDIATFSIIDYVGGLEDLRAGVVRAMGEPDERHADAAVRTLRAVARAAGRDLPLAPPVHAAIRQHRHEIAKGSPPRLLEEYCKILRAGASEKTFRGLAEVGLLEPISDALHAGAADPLWRSLAGLDAYRRRFDSMPASLTNPVLLGSLIVPLGIPLQPPRQPPPAGQDPGRQRSPLVRLGQLPLARRDVERLQQILALQRRLHDLNAHPRVQRSLTHRHVFADALTWLE